MELRSRAMAFTEVLSASQDRVSLERLRSLSFYGVPDEVPHLRAQTWKVLLGVLPLHDPQGWGAHRESLRSAYESFLDEFDIVHITPEATHRVLYENADALMEVKRNSPQKSAGGSHHKSLAGEGGGGGGGGAESKILW